MTKEQKGLLSQVRENERLQKQLSESAYKREARFKALEIAQYLNPLRNAVLFPETKVSKGEYDIVKKAEEIYQWLIKAAK